MKRHPICILHVHLETYKYSFHSHLFWAFVKLVTQLPLLVLRLINSVLGDSPGKSCSPSQVCITALIWARPMFGSKFRAIVSSLFSQDGKGSVSAPPSIVMDRKCSGRPNRSYDLHKSARLHSDNKCVTIFTFFTNNVIFSSDNID